MVEVAVKGDINMRIAYFETALRADPYAPDTAFAQWVNSVFHRFSILRPDLLVIGYGDANVGVAIEDMEFGFAVATAAPSVLYPGAG